MPIDLQKINQKKEKIISTLNLKGPSLPIHISKAIEEQPLFTSAYLSELFAEQKIKSSNLRIGSSALYYLPGQEPMLENFLDSLNGREKEAALLLKKDKLLQDETLQPVMRVAIRAIKDFAIPINIKQNNEQKLYWKYFLVEDNLVPSLIEPKHISAIPLQTQTIQPLIPIQPQVQQVRTTQEITIKEENKPLTIKQKKEKKEKKPKVEDLKFVNKILDYLKSKDIEVTSIIEQKKKEFYAKISLNTIFGKQEFYLIAKDKKKILEEELILAHHKAQQEKMPALILAPGEIDKKSLEHAALWKNLVKFEKVKL
jgi:hypothetical protein